MRKIWDKIVLVFLITSVIASTVVIINYDQLNETSYLLDEQIPGIVKGTAKMVDTETYFTKHTLQQSSIKLDLVCNNSANLEIALGYKASSEPLAIAALPLKEKVIWEGSVDSAKSVENENPGRLLIEKDLSSFGFTTEVYVKANERIFYLRINDISGGPYGYETIIPTEINGSVYELPEYIPNICHLNKFKLIFDDLIFETMLYPFFDGSTEIVIPIRGVSHELAIENQNTYYKIYGKDVRGSYSATTPPIGSNSLWAIVFGTSNYDSIWFHKLDYPPMECRSFILGCARTILPDEFEPGIMDYGWRVAYCMDGNTSQTDIATCTKTDDGYLESMFDFANGKLGLAGKLIVFVSSHGLKVGTGDHMTITGNSNLIWGWTNAVHCDEYEDKVDTITNDGTHILLWISACHGDGLNDFSSSDHNYCLESWSFKPVHEGVPSTRRATDGTYNSFCWLFNGSGGVLYPNSECAFFFYYAAQGACEYTVTEIGPIAKYFYDCEYDSTMYIQSTWSANYYFYINWGY
ncbi:MAG: hypothetical protein JXA54_07730 [Candidatus Heimdallarchaeota archaeon]|nr:hypothetical protein [Candidatus Heimdallarchaeota archaeon]